MSLANNDELQNEIEDLLFGITTKDGYHALSDTLCFEVAEEILGIVGQYENK